MYFVSKFDQFGQDVYVKDKLLQSAPNLLNMAELGMNGDGVTDNATALQSILNTPGAYYLPEGEYLVNSACIVKSNTTITGPGTIKTGSTCPLILGELSPTWATEYNGVHDVTIEGITIDGQYLSTDCIIMAHCKDIVIRGVKFTNCNEHAVECNSSKNILFENCSFTNIATNIANKEAVNIDSATQAGAPSIGQWDNTPCDNIKFHNCLFENCDGGMGNHASNGIVQSNITVTGCMFTGCNVGFRGFDYNNVFISECIFNTKSYCVQLNNVGATIANSMFTCTDAEAYTISEVGSKAVMAGCYFVNCTCAAIANVNNSVFLVSDSVEIGSALGAFASVLGSNPICKVSNCNLISSTTNIIVNGRQRSKTILNTQNPTFEFNCGMSAREAIMVCGASPSYSVVRFVSISTLTGEVTGDDNTSKATFSATNKTVTVNTSKSARTLWLIE